MALQTTTITPTPAFFPFAGLGQLDRDRSAVPFGQIRYAEEFSVPTPGAGNNQRCVIDMDLPQNAAWVLAEISLEFYGDSATSVRMGEALAGNSARAELQVTDSGSGTDRQFRWNGELVSDAQAQFGDAVYYRVYTPLTLPKMVLLPPRGQAAQVTLDVYNPTANDQAYTGNVYCRLLGYQVDQTYHWQPNTPLLTR